MIDEFIIFFPRTKNINLCASLPATAADDGFCSRMDDRFQIGRFVHECGIERETTVTTELIYIQKRMLDYLASSGF